LPPDRWHELSPVFRAEFGTDEMPDPARFEIRVKEGGGEIVAFYMLERKVVHGGPFWVAPSRRGNGLAREMAEDALTLTEGEKVYISAMTPEAEHLAESLGLTRIKGRLWHKRG
jgi:GNAT superfamily N-acetyltransferase